MRMGLTIFLALISLSVKAEYRMFVLEINNSKMQKSRTVYSTMDPLQYKTIYPLAADESIEYTATWRCRGNTSGFKIHCARPLDKIAENQSQDSPQN